MPYISTEEVKRKREAIKKEFPKFKFSITKEHYSSLNVDILAAPINMITNKEGRPYEQVNHYYIKEHYAEHPEVQKILLRIYEIMHEGCHIISEDGDYGSVPNFYTNISIGNWEHPFQVITS